MVPESVDPRSTETPNADPDGSLEFKSSLVLKCGSGPVRSSGRHLGAVEQSENEAEEDGKLLGMSGKKAAPGGGNKVPQKKPKPDEDDDGEEDNEDEEDEDVKNCFRMTDQEAIKTLHWRRSP
ncbi:Nucleophosmin [Microtus ochrogaster]|uniref:Nucleophosmin n=1 Tax=Microtus ochrogaster TaxID=79684 RepID=A0A8J6L570_MICOH|nr:Nucleophosmin [Microtus ochrogaster]